MGVYGYAHLARATFKLLAINVIEKLHAPHQIPPKQQSWAVVFFKKKTAFAVIFCVSFWSVVSKKNQQSYIVARFTFIYDIYRLLKTVSD